MAPWEEAQRCLKGLGPWTLGPSGAQSAPVMGEIQDMEGKQMNDTLESQASSVVSSEGKEEPPPTHIWGIWGKSYQLCDKVHTT